MAQKKMIIERQTYSLLEWLGDVGGLFDGLTLLAHVIITPFVDYAVKATHLTSLFKQSDAR